MTISKISLGLERLRSHLQWQSAHTRRALATCAFYIALAAVATIAYPHATLREMVPSLTKIVEFTTYPRPSVALGAGIILAPIWYVYELQCFWRTVSSVRRRGSFIAFGISATIALVGLPVAVWAYFGRPECDPRYLQGITLIEHLGCVSMYTSPVALLGILVLGCLSPFRRPTLRQVRSMVVCAALPPVIVIAYLTGAGL